MEELIASLLRAGDHISTDHPVLYRDGANGGSTTAVLKLWQQLPSGAKAHVSAYIRGFAKTHGWRVERVRHRKFSIEVTLVPSL